MHAFHLTQQDRFSHSLTLWEIRVESNRKEESPLPTCSLRRLLLLCLPLLPLSPLATSRVAHPLTKAQSSCEEKEDNNNHDEDDDKNGNKSVHR